MLARCVKPSSAPAATTDLLQCYNPQLLIAGKCLISFERVITTGGFTVCEPSRSTGGLMPLRNSTVRQLGLFLFWFRICDVRERHRGSVLVERHEAADARAHRRKVSLLAPDCKVCARLSASIHNKF